MPTNNSLLKRIEQLEARNRRVEADKGWETSWTRRLAIMFLTYWIVVAYLQFVVHIDPWINALVPVIGFFLSGLTLTLLKRQWIANRIRSRR
ncbi:MAG TPA: hypothetical protein VFH39_04790 [Candidatus Saccharimonadales bacterium]|nr:hypothetical protein [Candidatus Saccharimonadales bacterium]